MSPKKSKKRAKKKEAPKVERPAEVATGALPLRVSGAIGVAAAVVIAVLLNILAARHYRRWDFTEIGLYTLSPFTEQTLSTVREPLEIFVLLSQADPLALTIRHVLEAYRARTDKLEIQFVDPDRSPAELIAVQQRFGVTAGRTEAGTVVTDAAVIVARGDKRHFLTSDDLVAVEAGEEARARPTIERALTGAIRIVQAGKPQVVCFTSGHGELSLEVGGNEGLLSVHSRLEKLNYEVRTLQPLRDVDKDPIGECKLVVVAGPSQPLEDDEVKRLVHYVESGGNALVFVGPEPSPKDARFVDVRLAPLLALAGVKSNRDVVFELDEGRRAGVAQGEMFMAEPKPHAVTQGFVDAQGAVPIMLAVTSSLAVLEDAAVEPTALLGTSDNAFGMSAENFFAWAGKREEPERRDGDVKGPLTVAFAAEIPQKAKGAEHGPRLVIVGSNGAIWGANWLTDQTRGTALFVESAISWLAAQPIALEIPEKPATPVGVNITEEALGSAFVKVVLLLPLAPVLLGLGIFFRRRATEGRKKP
ncbi:MAG TPA: GldG family protein [Polyangiaceae bacterium]|jgi:hypothetical protein|nr:GldG family protein [Polyangiaceae bacterium]